MYDQYITTLHAIKQLWVIGLNKKYRTVNRSSHSKWRFDQLGCCILGHIDHSTCMCRVRAIMIVAAGNQLWVYNVVSHSNLIDAELRHDETKYEGDIYRNKGCAW